MTFTDYLVDSLLVLLVLRQVRESRFGRTAVYLPLGVIAWAMHQYLRTLPISGNDLLLIAGLTVIGIGFGTVSALATRIRTDGGRHALVKAGWIAAGVWVLSMGSRFGFVVWLTHGGGVDVFRWSRTHAVSTDSWTAALLLMALGEVVARTAILLVRTRRALGARRVAAEPQLVTV